jgi:hypothetical protein
VVSFIADATTASKGPEEENEGGVQGGVHANAKRRIDAALSRVVDVNVISTLLPRAVQRLFPLEYLPLFPVLSKSSPVPLFSSKAQQQAEKQESGRQESSGPSAARTCPQPNQYKKVMLPFWEQGEPMSCAYHFRMMR